MENVICTLTINGNKYDIADKYCREQLESVGDNLGDIETALDSIIAMQNELIGGDGV